MDILKALVQIRREKKVKQESVKVHLGITQSTLSRYETGKRIMPYVLLDMYAEYLGYEVRLLKK